MAPLLRATSPRGRAPRCLDATPKPSLVEIYSLVPQRRGRDTRRVLHTLASDTSSSPRIPLPMARASIVVMICVAEGVIAVARSVVHVRWAFLQHQGHRRSSMSVVMARTSLHTMSVARDEARRRWQRKGEEGVGRELGAPREAHIVVVHGTMSAVGVATGEVHMKLQLRSVGPLVHEFERAVGKYRRDHRDLERTTAAVVVKIREAADARGRGVAQYATSAQGVVVYLGTIDPRALHPRIEAHARGLTVTYGTNRSVGTMGRSGDRETDGGEEQHNGQ